MKTIHLIANAHLDPVWLWRWEEGCTEALSTFRTAVEILDEYPNFIFNHNESLLYAWVEENDPALFADIKRLVEAGRWNIMGGWYLQPDCNMPAGESFVRNILTGRKYFSEKFGLRPSTAINFDSFGHSRGLVQVFRKAGFDSYVVYRGGQSHRFKEHDFIWQGLDGSEITVHRSDEGYNSVYGHAADKLREFLDKNPDEQLSLFLWGVGDHGGGPSREDLEKLAVLCKEEAGKVEVLHSTPQDYFAAVRAANPTLPTTDDGLNPVAEGCYTSQIRVKLRHRLLENELYSLEKMLSSAALQFPDFRYPKEKMAEVKDDLLFSEFHDALPGSATAEVEEDTLCLLDHGLEIVAREKMRTFLALCGGQARVIDGTTTFFLYNPHPFEITGDFTCEMGLPKQNWEHCFMHPAVRQNGQPIPTQCEKECSNFGLDWRKRVTVHATLPPSSMNRFDVYWKPIEKRPTFEPIDRQRYFEFDNGEMQVKISTVTGLIESIVTDGAERLAGESFALVAYDDSNNPWGIDTRAFGRRQFNLMLPHEGSEFSGLRGVAAPSVRVIEDGPVRTVVEALFSWHNSRAYQRYILPKTGRTFEIETGVDWGEREKYLKLEMQPASADRMTGQIVFGREELKTAKNEAVYQKWAAAEDDGSIFAVINDGIHGGSLRDGVMGLTLLRSAAYTASADNTGPAMREIRYAPRMDQGMHIYRFKVLAGGREAVSPILDREALWFNERPYAMAHIPSGRGTAPKPLVSIDNSAVMLSCFKAAEDGRGFILRLYEGEGKAANATLTLPAAEVSERLQFAPFEIKTLRLYEGKLLPEELLEGY